MPEATQEVKAAAPAEKSSPAKNEEVDAKKVPVEVEEEPVPTLVAIEKTQEKELTKEEMTEELAKLMRSGKEFVLKRDYYGAADAFGKACEFAAKVYEEMSEPLAEKYYLYGAAMLECGRAENTVLGENVKENDDDDDDEDEDDEPEAESKAEGENKEKPESEAKVEPEDKSKDEPVSETKVESETKPKETPENETKEEDTPKKEDDSKTDTPKKEDDSKTDTPMETDAEIESKPGSSADANGSGSKAENGKEDPSKENGTKVEEEEEDDDAPLKVAWEMFELSKVIFEKTNNEKRLADTYIKLGEVGIESGHPSALDDMKKALKIRQGIFPGERIVSETHFNLGLAYSMFQMFDDAIESFEASKALLEKKIESLSKIETQEAKDEIKEIQDLLPDLNEKIQDMAESRKDQKADEVKKQAEDKDQASSSVDEKPTSDITHLVKRKRKIDEVSSDLQEKTENSPKKLNEDKAAK